MPIYHNDRLIKIICILISIVLFPTLCISADSNVPIVSLSTKVIDMGTIIKGETYNSTVTITNAGSAPLKIRKITTSCGCTAALLDKSTIKPGEYSTLQIKFNSKGFKGHVTKKVSFSTNDPNKKSHSIIISGEIKAEIVSTPRSLFIQVPESGIGSGTLILKNTSNYVQRVRLRKTNSPLIYATLTEDSIPPGGGIELQVTVEFTGSKTQVSEKLSVFTPDAKDSKIQIPIYARIK